MFASALVFSIILEISHIRIWCNVYAGDIEANGGRGMAGCSSAGNEMSPLLSADASLGDLH
jgi:hypothetical protein